MYETKMRILTACTRGCSERAGLTKSATPTYDKKEEEAL